MRPACSYKAILNDLGRHLPSKEKNAHLIALVFCRPQLSLTQEQIIPSLGYFHLRSGHNTTFYFAGFRSDELLDDPYEYEVSGPESTWIFNEKYFNQLRLDVESLATWKYSGGNDLILVNGRYNEGQSSPFLDFHTAVSLSLDKITRQGSKDSVSELFEKIFSYAEAADRDDPVWGLSDSMGGAVARRSIRSVLISILPKDLRGHLDSALDYVVRDLARGEASR